MITEGSAHLALSAPDIASKKMEVFYNPVMALNRTLTILLLKVLKRKMMQVGLPLAGSGVRGVRLLKELPLGMFRHVWLNDGSKEAVKRIRKHLKMNEIPNSKVTVMEEEASTFLLGSHGFDYIDIDPFGSPNSFLDAAIKRLSRKGILAVTATDTSSLSGTHPKACRRKYWADPLRNEQMHEIGIRILIRKIQLVAAQYDKALTPIFSYSKDHYFRVVFMCEKGKTRVDVSLKQHGRYLAAGPLWLGQLWDKNILKRMLQASKGTPEEKFIRILYEESLIPVVGFYHLPTLSKGKKGMMRKQEDIIKDIKKKRKKVAESHFAPNSLRSTISQKKLINILS